MRRIDTSEALRCAKSESVLSMHEYYCILRMRAICCFCVSRSPFNFRDRTRSKWEWLVCDRAFFDRFQQEVVYCAPLHHIDSFLPNSRFPSCFQTQHGAVRAAAHQPRSILLWSLHSEDPSVHQLCLRWLDLHLLNTFGHLPGDSGLK